MVWNAEGTRMLGPRRGLVRLRRVMRWARSIPQRFHSLELRLGRLESSVFAAAEEHVVRVAELLTPHPSSHRFERIGDARDGGYVIATDFGLPETAVSIGVGHECSADEALANRGTRVFQFDHTVESSPSSNPNITFLRRGLGGSSDESTAPLQRLIEAAGITRDQSCWLLIDAEGAEWDLLNDETAPLVMFDQIVMEIHLLSLLGDPRTAAVIIAGLETLRRDFTPIAWHPNNFGPIHVIGRRMVPDVIEATFIRTDRFLAGDHCPDPGLFLPNDQNRPEHPEPFLCAPYSALGALPECFATVLD
jgi:hypothetical protein